MWLLPLMHSEMPGHLIRHLNAWSESSISECMDTIYFSHAFELNHEGFLGSKCAVQVFEPKEWASLTGRSILPKLAYCLDHEFTVNPVDQKLEPWECAMSWSAVLPRYVRTDMLAALS